MQPEAGECITLLLSPATRDPCDHVVDSGTARVGPSGMAGLLEHCSLAFQLYPTGLALPRLAGSGEAAIPPTWKVAPLPPRRLLGAPGGSQSKKRGTLPGLRIFAAHSFASKWSRSETGFPGDPASLVAHGHLSPCRTLGPCPREQEVRALSSPSGQGCLSIHSCLHAMNLAFWRE